MRRLICLIGKGWIDARDEAGGRRLDNPSDFVRIEIESALGQGKRVIPVLVGEARMPNADHLPDAMKPLVLRQAVRLTHERFRADTQALIAALQRALKKAERTRVVEWRPEWRRAMVVAAAIGVVIVSAIGVWYANSPPTSIAPAPAPGAPAQTTVAPPAPIASTPAPAAPKQTIATPAPTPAASAQTTGVSLSPDQERALKPKSTFRECTNCPEMIVVPAGSFMMGSPESEPGHSIIEGPQHRVTIARKFAVGQFALTFDEWDACVADGGCNGYRADDHDWGRGRRPVINLSWNHAKAYVAWLSKKTGGSYRLLSEAEYEYAARAGTQTAYPWGDAIGKNNANCVGCGSQWDHKQTAPVGSFAANQFGLYDIVGNVWAWTEDCLHGTPADGSPWTDDGDCSDRVTRGGSWLTSSGFLRSAYRAVNSAGRQFGDHGFRLGRTLIFVSD